jgi:hypothetical protein
LELVIFSSIPRYFKLIKGTSNAINTNLDIPTPELALLAIINGIKVIYAGKTMKMDAFAAIQNNTIMYSHLSVQSNN